MRPHKAVIPVAGIGTRTLPASKVVPKELLPVFDRPAIQHIVEEAVAAGITDIIFVTSRSKEIILNHFDALPELEDALLRREKHTLYQTLERLHRMATYIAVRQSRPLGLGHAVLCAKPLLENEPFVVLLGDNLVAPETPCLPQMIDAYERYQASVLLLSKVPANLVSSYGIAAIQAVEDDLVQVTRLVEKPEREEAPSNWALVGRYVLTPDIFPLLEQTSVGIGGELHLSDAMVQQVQQGRCYGVQFSGTWYDTGTPLGLLTTSLTYALAQPDVAPFLREHLRAMLDPTSQ